MSNNINGFGVNTNITVGTPQTSRNYVPQNNSVSGNPSYQHDGYSFNMTGLPSGKVPDVKAGMWDSVSSAFSDVLNTNENIALFKTFQASVKQNPQSYIQPGSSDSTRVLDLQKKLSALGFATNLNGNFGPSTEKAVINFKNSVGINDGFLDKKGNYVVSSIVTPETMNVLNSKIAGKLNNGSGGGYIPQITSEELSWAKQLQGKIVQFGYKPSNAERQKYDSIYQKQQLSVSASNGTYNPSTIPGPTPQETDWAKQLILKMKQFGYKPSQDEKDKYNDIYQRQQIAKNAPKIQPQIQTQNISQNNAPSQNEMSWATDLMNKIKGGYNPTADEKAKYQEIYNRYKQGSTTSPQLNTQNQTTQTNGTQQAVSDTEFAWAKQLEAKSSQGYKPNKEEVAMYTSIYNRMNANKPAQNPVTQTEMQWAQQLESKVDKGYNPTPSEKSVYDDIFARWKTQGSQPQNNAQQTQQTVTKPSDQEVAWALDLEKKSKAGYQPTQNELAVYTDIAKRLEQVNAQQQNSGTITQPVTNNPLPKPVQNTPQVDDTTDNQPTNVNTGMQEFSYSNDTIAAFKASFPGVRFSGNSVPYLPDSVAQKVATKYGYNSVEELQSAIGAKVDGKFGPETFFRLSNALSGQKPSSRPTQSTQTSNTTSPKNGVTQEELNWAVNLQNKLGSGYKPSEQEKARYTDIYTRYQNSGQTVVDSDNQTTPQTNGVQASASNAPTQEELQWAQNLQAKVGSGYQATQQEIAKYTDIFNRYNNSAEQQNTQQSVSQPSSTQNQGNVQYTTSFDNVPKTSVNTSSQDPELAWALQLLDKVQNQGYVPTDQEARQYEQIIAKNQTIIYNQ